MSVLGILLESRVDLLKRRYPNLSDEDVSNILSMDPTDTKKFILWLAREYNPQLSFAPIKQVLIDWEANIGRLTYDMLADFQIHFGFEVGTNPTPNNYKDINTYRLHDVGALMEYLHKIPTRSQIRNIAKSETNTVYEGVLDGYNVLIVQPLSYRSSCYYGATTKWCTASKTTRSNYDHYTDSGELFYIIFKDINYADKTDGKPIFKYAIYFRGNEIPQVFDETDRTMVPETFFERFPGIKRILKDYFPLTTYEALQRLAAKQYNNDIQLKTLLNRLAESTEDTQIIFSDNLSEIKNGVIELYFNDDFLLNTFVSEDSHYVVSAAMSQNSMFDSAYSRDSYEDDEDWNNGYIFQHFNNDTWQALKEYFALIDTNGVELIKKIVAHQDRPNYDLLQQLVTLMDNSRHADLREKIISNYSNAMEEAINEGGDEAIRMEMNGQVKAFFDAICKDPFQINGVSSVIVTFNDILRWYQNGEDTPLPDDAIVGAKSVANRLRKLNNGLDRFGIYDAYEFYYDGTYDQNTFESEFDPIQDIEDKIFNLELDSEVIENADLLDVETAKLKNANILMDKFYQTPDNKYQIKLLDSDIINQLFKVLIIDLNTHKNKIAYLSAERIINLLTVPTMFDVIDEVYALFGKIV